MPLLLDWFLQPLGLVFTGLLISQLWLHFLSRAPRMLKLSLAGTTAILWLCSAPLTSNALVRQIEKPFHTYNSSCSAEQKNMPVVVLGADLDAYVESDNPYEVLSHQSLLRAQHAASLNTGSNIYYALGGGQ
ncbi:unnamed protein product, partial [Hapterophycus canaliculatus]